MFSYYACGLSISSTFPLPEIMEADGKPDITIRRGKVEDLPEDSETAHSSFRVSNDEICLCWRNVGAFLIKGGQEVVVDAADGVDESILRLFLLGRVLGTLLHQRGQLVLHASAVSIGGQAVAFLGGKGYGKSTTAAAMYTAGHTVVSDDIVAIEVDGVGAPRVFPGYPQLKLWPEAAASLGEEVENLPRLHPDFEKRARRVDQGFSTTPMPLKRIYVLSDGESQRINPIRPQDAFVETVRHSYAVKLLEATKTGARHFLQCRKLVDSVSVYCLERPASLADLPHLVRLVENNISRADEIASEITPS